MLGHGYFIGIDGKLYPLWPGQMHSVYARKKFRCNIDRAMKKGYARIACSPDDVFIIESVKDLSKEQKDTILDIVPRVKVLIYSIAGKQQTITCNIAKHLFALLGR